MSMKNVFIISKDLFNSFTLAIVFQGVVRQGQLDDKGSYSVSLDSFQNFRAVF